MFKKQIDNWHITYSIFGIKFKTKLKPQKIKSITVILDEKSGLGNRINGIMNVINYFEPENINIYWDTKAWVTAPFHELFSFEGDCSINEFSENADMTKISKSFHIGNPTAALLRNKKGKVIGLKYDKIDENSREEYLSIFEKLKPSQKVINRINAFKTDEEYIALQVRNNNDWEKYGRNESLELFFNKIEQYPKNTKFYLSAMNKETSNIFKEKYPNQILELPNKNYSSMVDAVADTLILGKGKEAIYSYGSTFPELGWWLSGAKQKVQTIGNDDGWKYPSE